MEINQINNTERKTQLANFAVSFLNNKNLISKDELKGLNVNFGYIFTKEDGILEALFCIKNNKDIFYFALQNNSLQLLNLNEKLYLDTIDKMKNFHSCLKDVNSNETLSMKNRKENNNKYLSEIGISFNENLIAYNDSNIQIKSLDEIIKRAIACLITIQIACDINNGDYEESLEFFKPFYERYSVTDSLNSKEKRIVDGTYSNQDAIDMDWAYEALWSLLWSLSLVEDHDIIDSNKLCDCDKCISILKEYNNYEELKNKCSLKSVDEILNMHDLYFRYNWAINNKQVNHDSNIGNINPSCVIERRRGLEWIISNKNDWYDLDMNA